MHRNDGFAGNNLIEGNLVRERKAFNLLLEVYVLVCKVSETVFAFDTGI